MVEPTVTVPAIFRLPSLHCANLFTPSYPLFFLSFPLFYLQQNAVGQHQKELLGHIKDHVEVTDKMHADAVAQSEELQAELMQKVKNMSGAQMHEVGVWARR